MRGEAENWVKNDNHCFLRKDGKTGCLTRSLTRASQGLFQENTGT